MPKRTPNIIAEMKSVFMDYLIFCADRSRFKHRNMLSKEVKMCADFIFPAIFYLQFLEKYFQGIKKK